MTFIHENSSCAFSRSPVRSASSSVPCVPPKTRSPEEGVSMSELFRPSVSRRSVSRLLGRAVPADGPTDSAHGRRRRPGTAAPLCDAASEMPSKPARHRALRREAEQFGDRGQWPVPVLDQPRHELCALLVQNGGKARAAVEKLPMDGAPIASEIFGDAFDRASAAGQQ